MSDTAEPERDPRYEIRIRGLLDAYWGEWFGGLTVVHESDGTTTLSGALTDQAALHGLLTKVGGLGMTLISVKVVEGDK
jgi:hypothetical protein